MNINWVHIFSCFRGGGMLLSSDENDDILDARNKIYYEPGFGVDVPDKGGYFESNQDVTPTSSTTCSKQPIDIVAMSTENMVGCSHWSCKLCLTTFPRKLLTQKKQKNFILFYNSLHQCTVPFRFVMFNIISYAHTQNNVLLWMVCLVHGCFKKTAQFSCRVH